MAHSESLSDQQWDSLAVILEAFSGAWSESQFPPNIAEYIEETDETIRRHLVSELIKLDLENRWQRGLRRVLEDYEADIPNLRTLITAELIFEEYQLRRMAGDRVSPGEMFRRFPEHAASLGQFMQMDPALRSTVLSDPGTESPIAEFQAGDKVDDFDLMLRVGRGAFATVFLARQRSMQRLVALKISADRGTEAQTLAQLDHENIIRVYDQRVLNEPPVRLLYMQYAAGGTLADIIRMVGACERSEWNGALYLRCVDQILEQRGETPPSESAVRARLARFDWPDLVCWTGSRLAHALAYAHRRGVLHRDLKPANILLTAEGVPRIADFNVSFGNQIEGTSAASDFGGSLAYMSPEQLDACDPSHRMRPEDLTPASDLYSLGMVLLEFLTGSRPVNRRDAETVSEQQPAFANSGSLEQILRRCLRRRPEERYQDGDVPGLAMEICLDREAQELLNDDESRWKRFVRRWPQTSIVGTTLIPNLVMAVFNFLYNHGEIQQSFPQGESTFLQIQSWINMVAFTVGIASSFWLIRSVTQATRLMGRDSAGLSCDVTTEVTRRDLRSQCLQLGNTAAVVSVVLWLIAGPVYPIALHLWKGDVPVSVYQHFVASLTLCGLIVAAYPFFGVSLIAVRGLYPSLAGNDILSSEELPAFRRLSRWAWFHLILAAAVPMVSVLVLALAGLNRRWALIILAAAGSLGVGMAITAFRLLQHDIQVLSSMIRTPHHKHSGRS